MRSSGSRPTPARNAAWMLPSGNSLPLTNTWPVALRIEAKNRLRNFAAARPYEPREAEHFAAPQNETHTLKSPRRTQIFNAQISSPEFTLQGAARCTAALRVPPFR